MARKRKAKQSHRNLTLRDLAQRLERVGLEFSPTLGEDVAELQLPHGASLTRKPNGYVVSEIRYRRPTYSEPSATADPVEDILAELSVEIADY